MSDQNAKKATLNISIDAEDKRFLKVYAAEHDTSIAAIIKAMTADLRSGKWEAGK